MASLTRLIRVASECASVFYLRRTGGNYFYVTEFTEGQTLESLNRRSGRLDPETPQLAHCSSSGKESWVAIQAQSEIALASYEFAPMASNDSLD